MAWPRRVSFCFGHAKFAAAGMEDKYALERGKRVAKALGRFGCLAFLNFCFVSVMWTAAYPESILRVWQGTMLVDMLGVVVLLALHRGCPATFAKYHDSVAFVLVCCNSLAFCTVNDLSLLMGIDIVHTVYDEAFRSAYLLLGGFIACSWLQLKWYYSVLFVHSLMAAQVAIIVSFGTDLMPTQHHLEILAATYFWMLMILVDAFASEGVRRDLFQARMLLEVQMQRSSEIANTQHTLELKASQQAALLSFVRSVFDIVGQLFWHAGNDFEEPRLHFATEENRALNELLQCSASLQPLDALLGAMPVAPGSDRDQWQQERQRLWTYVEQAVGEHRGEQMEQDQHMQGQGLAGKVAVTCRAGGHVETIELFIQSSGTSEVLFGILRGAGERLPLPDSGAKASVSQGAAERRPLGGRSTSGSTTSSTSIAAETLDDMRPPVSWKDEDMRIWIDAAKSEMPTMQKSDAWRAVFNGPRKLLIYALDWARLQRRIRKRIARLSAQSSADLKLVGRGGRASLRLSNGHWSFRLLSGLRTWSIDMLAECSFEVMDAEADGAVPVVIRIEHIQQPVLRQLIGDAPERPPYETLLARPPSRAIETL